MQPISPNPTLRLGVAQIDITPPVGVTLWGYVPRISTFVEHPLRAEALACSDDQGGWLLLSADIGAFAAPFAEPLRAEIAAQTGLPVAAVMLAATHTHSGPHVTDAGWCERSQLESDYFAELRRKLIAVAAEAWQQRAPGSLVYARTTAPDLASNRRIQREDGSWTNEFKDPEGRHTGYFDPAVELVGVRRPDGRLEALLVNYGCHPVAFGGKNLGISGDYVGYLKDALEAAGAAGTVLFTVSGHANIDPRHGVQDDPVKVRDMGRQLADIIQAALAGLQPIGGRGIGAVQEPWSFTANWDITGRVAIYFPHAAAGSSVTTAISALRAGELALLGLPGETVSEYRQILQQTSPCAHTLLISLANDFIGYLPTDEILQQGAYEAKLCPLQPIQHALTSRVEAALNKLKQQPQSAPAGHRS